MAVGERARELAALRLAGATVAQTLWVLTLETLTVVAVGVVFGGAAAAGNVIGTRAALGEQTDAVRTVVPWVPLLGIVAACGAAALLATLLPAAGTAPGPHGARRRPGVNAPGCVAYDLFELIAIVGPDDLCVEPLKMSPRDCAFGVIQSILTLLSARRAVSNHFS